VQPADVGVVSATAVACTAPEESVVPFAVAQSPTFRTDLVTLAIRRIVVAAVMVTVLDTVFGAVVAAVLGDAVAAVGKPVVRWIADTVIASPETAVTLPETTFPNAPVPPRKVRVPVGAPLGKLGRDPPPKLPPGRTPPPNTAVRSQLPLVAGDTVTDVAGLSVVAAEEDEVVEPAVVALIATMHEPTVMSAALAVTVWVKRVAPV
jgi:hypothetical protein